ncbi:MAG: dihydroorotate dehydrogenase [Candidatus Omnitrophota bacterium]|nr:dihydroorotate dehydrogenase [Candidatus Omnitrophota bacterium]
MKNEKLQIKIGGLVFKNPIWVASGTFGTGEELKDFLDLSTVGAIVTKTVTLQAREGNPPPRVVETPSGMLNSIGLENKGAAYFIKEHLPGLKRTGTRVIASVAGTSVKDLVECAVKIMNAKDKPDAIELNLSCPNVSYGETKYKLLAQDPEMAEKTVKIVKKEIKEMVIVKLSPNVTDITEIARAAEAGGADAVAMINTYMGIAVDARGKRPILGNIIGGLSGPAIKPLALRAVWESHKKINIPIIGIGGIMSGEDAAEFMLCGASAVEIGTANLVSPDAHKRILGEFEEYLAECGIERAEDLIGAMGV